ncbi:MAG: alginate export family protein, partial [Candidatus Latescibacteria bacterium]|nr:alginate export family protein [Candidatus Latescibacterota bacterium]
MGCKRMLVMCLGVLLMFGPALAKEISFGGQVRPRAEFRDPAGVGYDVFTSMRVRAQMVAKLDRNVDAFVQIQDVRLWGEEGNTLGDFKADKFDLHQGYVTLNKINDSGLSIRAGRQAIAFGGQRLVGSVEWTQQGRVFDGLRATIKSERSNIDIIGIRLAEASSATHAANAYFWGAYANFKAGEGQAVDAFALYNRVSGGVTDQYTLGIRLVGKTGTVSYRAEGAFQTGER